MAWETLKSSKTLASSGGAQKTDENWRKSDLGAAPNTLKEKSGYDLYNRVPIAANHVPSVKDVLRMTAVKGFLF